MSEQGLVYREAPLIVENGGGNQYEIMEIVEELFDFRHPDTHFDSHNEELVNEYHQKCHKLRTFRESLKGLPCDHFYMSNGAKITRPLKALLTEYFGKSRVLLEFAEFCKRVGNIYVEVNATAMLLPTYFDERRDDEYGDSGSCFMPGGCNCVHGKFIDMSPCTGVIVIHPKNTYAKGRIIVWFKNETTAHLINKYSAASGREIPHSVFVRALEALTGTDIVWSRPGNDSLPIYLNNDVVLCRTQGDKTFASVVKSFKFQCPVCEEPFGGGDIPDSIVCCDEDEEMYVCESCEGSVHADDSYVWRDLIYCESCYNNRTFRCDHCGDVSDSDEARNAVSSRDREITICESCEENDYFSCDQCGDLFSIENRVSTCDESEQYCKECAEDNTFICKECGERFCNEQEWGDGVCEDCHDKREEEEEEEEEKKAS